MNEETKDFSNGKKRKVLIAVGAVVAYGVLFGILTLIASLLSSSSVQTQKSLGTDGTVLNVSDRQTGKILPQILHHTPFQIDGIEPEVFVDKGQIRILVGDKVYTHKTQRVREACWSLPMQAFIFLDIDPTGPNDVDYQGQPKKNIWKWSKATGFVRLTKKPEAFYNLAASLDGRYVSGLEIVSNGKAPNAIFTCSISDGTLLTYPYSRENFRPLMLSTSDFLLEVEEENHHPETTPYKTKVLRWSPTTQKSVPLVVEKPIESALPMGGAVWVLYREPVYHWYPWMVSRGDDSVTIGRLSSDLQKIDEKIPLQVKD